MPSFRKKSTKSHNDHISNVRNMKHYWHCSNCRRRVCGLQWYDCSDVSTSIFGKFTVTYNTGIRYVSVAGSATILFPYHTRSLRPYVEATLRGADRSVSASALWIFIMLDGDGAEVCAMPSDPFADRDPQCSCPLHTEQSFAAVHASNADRLQPPVACLKQVWWVCSRFC